MYACTHGTGRDGRALRRRAGLWTRWKVQRSAGTAARLGKLGRGDGAGPKGGPAVRYPAEFDGKTASLDLRGHAAGQCLRCNLREPSADSEAPDRILERDAGKGREAVRRTGPLSEAMRCGQAVEEIVCRNLQRPEMTQVADQNGPVAAHGREGSVQGFREVDVEED